MHEKASEQAVILIDLVQCELAVSMTSKRQDTGNSKKAIDETVSQLFTGIA